MNIAIRIEDGVISFVRHFNPKAPSFSISSSLILLVRRISIYQVSNIFVDHGAYPSTWSSIELKSLFLLAFKCSNFDFFARNGAIDFIGRWLLYDFGGEWLFGRRDNGKGVSKVVLRLVEIVFLPCFHMLKLLCF